MDIGAWLRGLGLDQYESAFRENEVDAEILPNLTVDDLKDLGIAAVGHRRKILAAIEAMQAAAANTAAAEASPTPVSAHDAAERRQLTVMFCDLVGSTALSARLDPEDMRRVIRAYQDAASGVVARYDGFVAKFMGDGVLAYFGFPRAHEDDAARAVHAGLEIARVVAGLETPARESLAARIGVATGLVVVGDIVGVGAAQEQAVVGDTPNLAARLQGLADAGAVVISTATRRLIGDEFRLKDLGRHLMKGLAEPVEAFAALGIAATESRFEAAHSARLTDLVGREAEAAGLVARQRLAWQGRGQIVLISGEAGIGKSRLSAWIAEKVAETPHTRLRYQCSPYHRDSALHPFVQQFERAAGFAAQDDAEAKLDKLEKVLALATDRLGEVAPLIAAMLSIPTFARYPPLSLSPAQQRRQTLFALIDQMEGLAKKQPILMLFEDAHWADATSLEVLDLAIERMRKLPVLLLITYRPEFEAPWKGLPDVATIALGRLERSQAEALVAQVTGGRKLPAEVLAQIAAKTDGVPLFVEELTKNVLESGLLIEEPDGYRLDGPLPPLAIPSTLQDSLMARLDRLAAVKEIAQIGAAIGREFSYALLAVVVGRDEPTLNAALVQLEESELVFRAGEPPAARYTFKHALVQDTAYESLLKSRRQILHQRIAEALRDKFPEIVEAEPELIAEHFARAGLTEPAIVHWGKAGDLALRRSAFKEAIAHLGKAIAMTEAGGAGEKEKADDKLKLQVSFGNALISARGYGAPETTAAFLRARESSAAGKDAPERFSVNYGVWVGSYLRGELADMRAHAATFLRDVGGQQDRPEAVVAERVAGITHLVAGEYIEARHHLERSLSLFDPERDGDQAFRFGHDSGLGAIVYLALTLWPLGEVDRSLRLIEAARERMAELNHVGSIAYGHFHAAVFGLMREDFACAAVDGVATEHLAREHDLNLWRAMGAFLKGWVTWRQGERDLGLNEMRHGAALLEAQNAVIFDGMLKITLARSEAESGDLARGLATLDVAIAASGHTGQRTHAAELHRIRGEILRKQNPADSAAAEADFLTAVAIAQSQKARSFELRAALALAKLHQSTGRLVEAHNVLAAALEGFAPTPEFPEIAEALALLETLMASDAVQTAIEARKQRARLQITLGNALVAARGYGAEEARAVFERASRIAANTADATDRYAALHGLWAGSFLRGELVRMRELAEMFLRDAEARPSSGEAGVGHRIMGVTLAFGGELIEAVPHFEHALAIFDPERDRDFVFSMGHDAAVGAMAHLAQTSWSLGEVGRARALAAAMISRAEAIKHPGTLGFALFHAAVFELMRRDFARAEPLAEALARLAREHDMALWRVLGAFLEGWRESRLADRQLGLARMRDVVVQLGAEKIVVHAQIVKIVLAKAEAEANEVAAALATIDGAIADVEANGQRRFEAELHIARGEILLQKSLADPALAEAAFLNAIAIARLQKARSFELRATFALAKLYLSTKRAIEAHDILGPALMGFATTPEFLEIAQAQTLLSELSAAAQL